MDSKEIERRSRDLQKAASTSEAPSTLLKLLAELRTGVKASEEILRSTKIGVAVNKLRQHKDSQVASKAAELVSKWRTDIKNGAGGVARKGSPAVNGNASGTATPVTSSGIVSPPASAPTQRKSNVPPEQRNAKADEVDTAKTGNATRDNCIKLMYDGLAFMSEEPPSQILPVAVDIEERVHFHYSPETSGPYKTKIRSLFQNLKIKQNIVLRSRVLKGDITPDAFAQMTQDDLKSDERRAEEDKMNKENMNKAMVAQEEKSISTSLVCGKCKEKKVSYTQAQTRSADEPMTTFCECTVCGNRWKFS